MAGEEGEGAPPPSPPPSPSLAPLPPALEIPLDYTGSFVQPPQLSSAWLEGSWPPLDLPMLHPSPVMTPTVPLHSAVQNPLYQDGSFAQPTPLSSMLSEDPRLPFTFPSPNCSSMLMPAEPLPSARQSALYQGSSFVQTAPLSSTQLQDTLVPDFPMPHPSPVMTPTVPLHSPVQNPLYQDGSFAQPTPLSSMLSEDPRLPFTFPSPNCSSMLMPAEPLPSARQSALYQGSSFVQTAPLSSTQLQDTLVPDFPMPLAPGEHFGGDYLPSDPNVPHTQTCISSASDCAKRRTERMAKRKRKSNQGRCEIFSDSSGSKEVKESEQTCHVGADGKPNEEGRSVQTSSAESSVKASGRTYDEPDLPDDGYSWNKYMQITTQGNPRFFYRCMNPVCDAKKIITVLKNSDTVIPLYEGEHNHVKRHSQ